MMKRMKRTFGAGEAPRPSLREHPQRLISVEIAAGADEGELIVDFPRTLPWRSSVRGMVLTNTHASAEARVRLNDGPPRGDSDVRGDIRVIRPGAYEAVRGLRVEFMGIRVTRGPMADSTDAETVQLAILAWTDR